MWPRPIAFFEHLVFCFLVTDREDLRALALACRRLHDIVIPNHTQSQRLRGKIEWEQVWKVLLEHPENNWRFSFLEIGTTRIDTTDSTISWHHDGLSGILPKSLFSSGSFVTRIHFLSRNVAVYVQRFISVLRSMSGLTQFHWLDSTTRLTNHPELLVALCLACPALQDLLVYDRGLLSHLDYNRISESPVSRVSSFQ